jgi:hypothetical protein
MSSPFSSASAGGRRRECSPKANASFDASKPDFRLPGECRGEEPFADARRRRGGTQWLRNRSRHLSVRRHLPEGTARGQDRPEERAHEGGRGRGVRGSRRPLLLETQKSGDAEPNQQGPISAHLPKHDPPQLEHDHKAVADDGRGVRPAPLTPGRYSARRTEKRWRGPVIPFSSTGPTSLKVTDAPSAASTTSRVTSTSPGLAYSAILAAMFTVRPK